MWQVADFGLSQKRKMGGCGTPCWMRCSGAYGRGVRGAISVYLSEVETKQYPLHLPSLLSMRDSFTSRLTILFDRMLAQQQPTQRQCRARNRTGQCTLTAPHRAVTHTHTYTLAARRFWPGGTQPRYAPISSSRDPAGVPHYSHSSSSCYVLNYEITLCRFHKQHSLVGASHIVHHQERLNQMHISNTLFK